MVRIAYLLFFLATAMMPLWSHGGLITASTALFILGAGALGLHAARQAGALARGRPVLAGVYRVMPLLLPTLVVLIRWSVLWATGDGPHSGS